MAAGLVDTEILTAAIMVSALVFVCSGWEGDIQTGNIYRYTDWTGYTDVSTTLYTRSCHTLARPAVVSHNVL